jgi:hypothetical protein
MGATTARYRVEVSHEVEKWLDTDSHPDPRIRAGIYAKFKFKADLLADNGTLIDGDHIRKVAGYTNLWEIRIKEGTILHRFFFGLGDGGVIGVACVVAKTSSQLRPAVLKNAERRVADYLTSLERLER